MKFLGKFDNAQAIAKLGTCSLKSVFGMEPVDKIRARTDALAALGLDACAGSDDIREAWRHIAFHDHPDHTGGDCADFARAKAAYDFLRKEGLVAKGAAGTDARMPRRPRLKKRVIEFPQDAIATCKDRLNPDRALSDMTRPQGSDPSTSDGAASDHVPDAVGFFGRHLTYFVPTPVCEGANRVALPTSVLTNARHTETEVLSFQSKGAGPGEVVIPETICARKFPGAKSVRIRFESTSDIRDEFWLAS